MRTSGELDAPDHDEATDGKMTLTPVTLADGSDGYELSGRLRYDRLLSGILTPNSRGGTSPSGK